MNGVRCEIIPCYNFSDQKKGIYCKNHMEPGMENVVSSKCENCGDRQPSFGLPGGPRTHCGTCRTEDMVNLRRKPCIGDGCNKQPSYNYPEEKSALYCSDHKLDGMKKVTNRLCAGVDCDKQPSYRHEYSPTYTHCVDHAENGMVSRPAKRCVSCGLFVVSHKPYLCSYCKPESTKRQRTKEMEVVKYLEERYTFVHNKSVGFSCGSYRPDIKIDAGTHLVIVEVDEDQHKQYDENCEIARMFNIAQAEGLPCVFLRYNPDTYKINGITKRVYSETRLKKLCETIDEHIEKIPETIVTVYRLYYDSHSQDTVVKYDIESKYEDMLAEFDSDFDVRRFIFGKISQE